MIIDEILRNQQRKNDLNVFLRYEQRLKLAYTRSKNPQPKRRYGSNNPWELKGWVTSHHLITPKIHQMQKAWQEANQHLHS